MGETKKCRILFMDDDKDIRNIITQMLQMEGFFVKAAENGEEALDIFMESRKERQDFDILVLDLSVKGGMGGKETLEEIRKMDPRVRAILSTGYNYDPVTMDYKEHGFSAVISKPYKFEDLTEMIEREVGLSG